MRPRLSAPSEMAPQFSLLLGKTDAAAAETYMKSGLVAHRVSLAYTGRDPKHQVTANLVGSPQTVIDKIGHCGQLPGRIRRTVPMVCRGGHAARPLAKLQMPTPRYAGCASVRTSVTRARTAERATPSWSGASTGWARGRQRCSCVAGVSGRILCVLWSAAGTHTTSSRRHRAYRRAVRPQRVPHHARALDNCRGAYLWDPVEYPANVLAAT
jgi:hypothetical protein